MWQAFVAASRTADYQYPSLDHYAAGAALTLLIRGLYQNYREGIVTRGQPSFDPVVTMAKTTQGTAEAKVTDCANDTHATTYYKSGKPAPGDPPGRHEVYARRPHNERGDLRADWRPSRPVRIGLLAGGQAAVPAQDGAGGDQPVRSQPSRQEPDQRGHHRPAGPVQPGPRMGSAQHGDLVPQQFGVLGGR